MLGKWNRWLEGTTLDAPSAFGDMATYSMAANFLRSCPIIEDWGCGRGGFYPFCHSEYIGVDGSNTPFATITADLTTYTSSVPGVLIRHVLEHNLEWDRILHNACSSATDRLCVILFTPLVHDTQIIGWSDELVDIPDIAFCIDDILSIVHSYGFVTQITTLPTKSQYKVETVIYATKD